MANEARKLRESLRVTLEILLQILSQIPVYCILRATGSDESCFRSASRLVSSMTSEEPEHSIYRLLLLVIGKLRHG